MSTVATHISDEMRAAIGRTYGAMTSYPIAASDIRKWAVAIYYPEEPPRLYWDEEYAKTTPFGGIVAPEDFNPFAWMAADPPGVLRVRAGATSSLDDIVEGKVGVKGPGLKFILNGGMETQYGVRMRPGDVISSITSLAEYREREGRLGLMLFTITETRWTNQRGEMVKVQRSTNIRY